MLSLKTDTGLSCSVKIMYCLKASILSRDIFQKFETMLYASSTLSEMITGKEAIRSAGMVISYLVMGKEMSKEEIAGIRQHLT